MLFVSNVILGLYYRILSDNALFIENAVLLKMLHEKTMDTCYELQHTFKKGYHVLTIVPTTDLYISLSYVVMP